MRFRMVCFQRSGIEEYILWNSTLHFSTTDSRWRIWLKNRHLGYWYPNLWVTSRQDSLQNILRRRSQQNSKYLIIQLEDKITFPEYVDLSYDAKDFVLKLLDRSPGGTYLNMDDILRHPFLNFPRDFKSLEGAEFLWLFWLSI